MSVAAIWHDVECGSYAADLELWDSMATAGQGPVLELGCGTGRVALHLARRGHRVVGVDSDPELLEALAERAQGLPITPLAADARDFQHEGEIGLALAPMQFLQLFATPAERVACMRCAASSLRPGGLLAAAIVERLPEPDGAPAPLPDVHDVDGWVYASLPTEAAIGPGEIVIRRLRTTVSPSGELNEEPNEVRIHTFEAAQLEAEGAEAGLVATGRRIIPPTDLHVGSTVVTLGRES
jgi:SAM-dependent methyltransferase